MPSPIVWQVGSWMAIVFNGLRVFGIAGILISLLQIDWQGFLGLRQLANFFNSQSVVAPQEVLVTRGLYKVVRHPLYFFSLLIIWFTPLMSGSWLVFSIGATLYFFIGSYFEEKKMLRQYGDLYGEYKKAVSWMIPWYKKQ